MGDTSTAFIKLKPVSELETVFNPSTGDIIYHDGEGGLKKTPLGMFLPPQTIFDLGELNEYTDNGVNILSLLLSTISDKDRVYSKIEGYFSGPGNMRVHVYKDQTPAVGSNFTWTKVSTHNITIPGSGIQEISIDDLEVKKGYFLSIDKDSTSQPFSAFGSGVKDNYQVADAGLTTCYGSLVDGLDMSIVFKEIKDSVIITPEVVNVTVLRNLEDYNSIRETISKISDASKYKTYIVNVPEGIWNESDLKGKDFVKIKGAGREKTILLNDSTGSMASLLSPTDYSFPIYANQALSTIPIGFKHIINARKDVFIEDLTLHAIDCKYPAHLDDPDYKAFYASNVNFKEKGCNFPLGVGGWTGQEIYLKGCVFEREISGLGIFVHNWNNQSDKFKFTVLNSKFVRCNYAAVDELGSNQDDEFNLIGCTTDSGGGHIQFLVDKDSDGKTYYTDPITGIKEDNPSEVPYCWIINTSGTDISTLESDDSEDFNPSFTGKQRSIEIIKERSIIKIYPFWYGTQSDYDALVNINPFTNYFIETI